MAIVLAIETSTNLASVALLKNDDTLIFRTASNIYRHSEIILPMVQQLLIEANIKLADCNLLAFGAGPGSFTGIRIACAIVQGLAFGINVPVAPIITLKAMAQAYLELNKKATDVLTILDARMNEVYWGQYRYIDNDWQVIIEPMLSSPMKVQPQGNVLACGNGLTTYKTMFVNATFSINNQEKIIIPHAAQIAVLGYKMLKQGSAISSQNAQPFYLRNKVALTTTEYNLQNFSKNYMN